MSFKDRAHHARYRKLVRGVFIFPIIAILGFLDLIPNARMIAWGSLAIFVVSLIVLYVSFGGEDGK